LQGEKKMNEYVFEKIGDCAEGGGGVFYLQKVLGRGYTRPQLFGGGCDLEFTRHVF